MHVSVNLISLRDFKLSSRVMLLQTMPCLKLYANHKSLLLRSHSL